MKTVISTSMMHDFLTCPKMFYYKHVLGRIPKTTSAALSVGRAWHKAMEGWWGCPDDRFNAAVAMIADVEDKFDQQKLRAMLAGYTARWGKKKIETVAVELAFEVPIYHPETGDKHPYCVLAGSIDKIVKEDGALLIVEHKTSSDDTEKGSDYWKRLAIDTQVSNYYFGSKPTHDIQGCLYDVATKPGIRPAKATPEANRKYTKEGKLYANQREYDETPEEYGKRCVEELSKDANDSFQRGIISRTEAALEAAAFDLWEVADFIEMAMESGKYPRNTRACRRIGGSLCEYFDVCAGTAQAIDNDRFKDSDYGYKKLPTVDSKPDAAVGF